jgi:hypothetical protein
MSVGIRDKIARPVTGLTGVNANYRNGKWLESRPNLNSRGSKASRGPRQIPGSVYATRGRYSWDFAHNSDTTIGVDIELAFHHVATKELAMSLLDLYRRPLGPVTKPRITIASEAAI